MKSVLEEIYYGNEGLVEKVNVSEDYDKINDEFGKVYEQLLEEVNNKQKEMLDELYFLMGGLESETRVTYFKEGFKFCMRLIFEGLGN